MSTSIATLMPLVMTRWRQSRRKFDTRLSNERRLIICAAVALVGFVLDASLITPGIKKFSAASARSKAAIQGRDALQDALQRRQQDTALQETEARAESKRIQTRIDQGKKALADHQSMLAPAREMRVLLESLLAQNGRLRVKAMRTMPPEEVKLSPVPGVAIGQTMLYRQSMEISVEGSFLEALTWLRSVESMPRKLLWDGMVMSTEEGKVTLALKVHTFSPDRDALEIVP